MGRIDNPKVIQYTEINTSTNLILGGAAGWIDTDVSAITGTDTNKVWMIGINVAGSQEAGARPHGSALEPRYQINLSGFCVSKVDNTGHIDFYRQAANANYYLLGSLE